MSGTQADAALPTLAQLLERQAARLGEQTFAIFPEGSISYAALYREARAMARGLIALGLRSGEHVAILMPNCRDFLVAQFAVQFAGGVAILLNARFKRHELEYTVPHCDAAMLLTTGCIRSHVDFAQVLEEAFPALAASPATPDAALRVETAPHLRHVVMFGEQAWAAALPAQRVIELGAGVSDEALATARVDQKSEETAVMIYTSGTTAAPKACELSHAGLQRSWRIFARAVNLVEGEKVWDPMPFFHSGGIGLMTGIMAAGAVIVSSAHYDPEVIVRLVLEHRIEHLYPGFHLLALPLLQSQHYDREAFGFVRTMVVIGPLGTLRTIQRMLPEGARVMSLFGMSEASGLVTLTPPEASEDLRLGSSGRPLYDVQVRICDPDDGEPLPAGQRGEIHFRGGGAFLGYYKDAAATAKALLPGGWVRTGDLGTLDADGWLRFDGRLKDMLKVGGENVAAAEIEAFLSGHPAVKIVQVLGRADERLGEVPVAFVECNDGMQVTREEILDYCEGKIARFRIPRDIIFVREWPMSATKIQKFKLRDLLPA